MMARATSFVALLLCQAYSATALSSLTTKALCYNRPTLAVGPKVVRGGSRGYAIASRLRGGGDAPAIGMSFGAAAQWYTTALTARPLLTKATTLFFISAFSDLNAQSIANRGKVAADPTAPHLPLDPHRTLTFAVMGATFIAPIVHYWFDALNALAHSPLLAGRPAGVVVLVQTLLDQLLAAPVVLASIFMVIGFYDHVMRAKPFSIRGVWHVGRGKLDRDYRATLYNNYRLWPLANLVNFAVVPPAYRVLYSNCVSVIWETYLSRQVNKKSKAAQAESRQA